MTTVMGATAYHHDTGHHHESPRKIAAILAVKSFSSAEELSSHQRMEIVNQVNQLLE
jgi:hypothetical protein